MSRPVRTTTTQYQFNAKHGGFRPTSMTVVVSEEIDEAAEQAKLKAQYAAQESLAKAQKEEDENIDGKE